MARQQLSLGGFVFSQQGEFAYETLERKSSGGWQRIDIVNAKPRAHNTGQGAETVRLRGKAFYAYGMDKLDELRALQAKREPLTLVDGHGVNWGRWTFDDLNENQERIIDDGTAMIVRWEMLLTEYSDEEDPQPGG
tara:strand:- start:258 stop:665 length:408 start_codon:yes stop_codon:yes gene_type:complete